MDTQSGATLSLEINTDHAQAPQTVATDVLNRMSNGISAAPLPSSPSTTNANASTPGRPSHPATSPLNSSSPKQTPSLRRTSSAMSLKDRSTSSPKLARKSSRSSLGAHQDDGDKRPTPKRSISNLISGLREAQMRMESIEEPVPLTAPQIAMEYFTRELIAHALPESNAETAVLFHDACYGHRFSRLKTSRSTLSMIVERPERILASALGVSTAYVRLGGHYAGAKNAPCPDKSTTAALPFKIHRTERSMDITSSYVTNVHGTAWMSELRNMCNVAGERLAAGAKELSRSSTPTEPQKRRLHEGDLYLSPASLNAFQGALGGVAEGVDAVFDPGYEIKRVFVAVRPPGHHCSADYPSGFCWLNNVHVGIEYAAQTYGLTHAAIIDFDLHHGDGSQAITWERNSSNNTKRLEGKLNSKLKLGPDVGYYSLHDINSYPCETGDDEKVQAASLCIENAHSQSIWNVHLQPWKTEAEFWDLYETRYRILLDKARAFLRHHTSRLKSEGRIQPQAAIFISAGFDASEWESAGMQRHKVNVPTEFYARFTRDIVELAQEDSSGCGGRVVSVLEGGYSDRALCSGVLSHLSGLCATSIDQTKKEDSDMADLDRAMRGLGMNGTANGEDLYYNKTWWSPANLTALEMKVNPPPPALAKKMRAGQQPTYATPTESFAYKVIDANKFARSISGTMREVPRPARLPTPPPPDVEWVTATQELAKLLIPGNRQTRSCTPEELVGQKVKKDLSAKAAPPAEDLSKPRQLRDRKAKAPAYPESVHSDEVESVRSVSRGSRRQTISDLPSSSSQADPTHQRRASRRLSAGSTLSSISADLDPHPPPIPRLPDGHTALSEKMAPAPGVQVKKARASVKPKKEATASAPGSPARSSKMLSRLPGPTTSSTGPPPSNDVDALTSGMKRINLKLGTKEEHDRKQKEKIDAERRARALKGAETRKANAAAKKAAKESGGASGQIGAQSTDHRANENTAPPLTALPAEPAIQPEMESMPGMQPFMSAPLPSETMLPNYSVSGRAMEDRPPTSTSLGIPSWADGLQDLYEKATTISTDTRVSDAQHLSNDAALPTLVQSTNPSTSGEVGSHYFHPSPLVNGTQPSVASSSPLRPSSAHQLPVWSSTGAIPFASNNGKSVAQPQFPSYFQGSHRVSSGPHLENNQSTPGTISGSIANTAMRPPTSEGNGDNIWDVPATPGH